MKGVAGCTGPPSSGACAASTLHADHFPEPFERMAGAEGLAHEVVSAGEREGAEVFNGRVTAEDDDRAVGPETLAELLGENQTGDVGQMNVHQGGDRRFLFGAAE